MFGAQIVTGQTGNLDVSIGGRAFFLERLALARGERREEVIIGAIAVILPDILPVDTVQQAEATAGFKIAGARKVHRPDGEVVLLRDLHGGAGEGFAHRLIGRQQTAAGDRRERNCGQEFRVIAPAGAFIGVRPGMVEHVFAV